eukprot:50240-Pelagomonas_calceolata.AAC.8
MEEESNPMGIEYQANKGVAIQSKEAIDLAFKDSPCLPLALTKLTSHRDDHSSYCSGHYQLLAHFWAPYWHAAATAPSALRSVALYSV